MKYLRPFNESNEDNDELTATIRDILADATDEGIELRVVHRNNINFLKQNKLDVILHNGLPINIKSFTLNDIKTGIDSLINMLNDEGYQLLSVEMADSINTITKYDIDKYISPWDYAQTVINDNRLELRIIKLVFKSN